MTETGSVPLAQTRGASRQRLTAAGLAEEELRAMILGGTLAPGERLNEVLIAESLGISRGPLREAIQRLASEGLLRVITHKGAYVRSVTETELVDLYELRIAIETYAVRLGVDRGTPEQLADLTALLQQTRATLDSGADAHYPTDLDLHAKVVGLAHNEALRQAMRDTHSRIHLARARSAYDPDRARAALTEHEEIVARIAARKEAEAAALLERHLRASLENALVLIRQRRLTTDDPRRTKP